MGKKNYKQMYEKLTKHLLAKPNHSSLVTNKLHKITLAIHTAPVWQLAFAFGMAVCFKPITRYVEQDAPCELRDVH